VCPVSIPIIDKISHLTDAAGKKKNKQQTVKDMKDNRLGLHQF